ncbi:MAG: hypothetical protein WB566_15620 [Terriglobales bacterium]
MKLSYRLLAFMMALLWSVTACDSLVSAAPIPKDKEKEHEGKLVDSGSFGVFQNGHRVGTETFSIYQNANGSVVQSEFKTENAPTQDVQTSELQLTASGNIRRYDWKELSPEKAASVVVPNEDFLNQKWSAEGDKDHEQPYLLPPTTSILDDYFFIQREVLAWKFLAAACKQEGGQVKCPPRQRAQFGTMNPHQHSSAPLMAESLGREKVNLKSGPQELNKLELKNDAGTWELWLDDQWKVMRISIEAENTVVDRD